MAIDQSTLEPLHPLSEEGKIAYDRFLLERADELILRSIHPFFYSFYRILNLIGLNSERIERKYESVLQEIKENRS